MVNIAQIQIAKPPDQLCALGLGSCVGVVLYDPKRKVGGMLHVLLPTEADAGLSGKGHRTKFADPGLLDLREAVIRAGAMRDNLEAKLAGGAAVLAPLSNGTAGAVGQRNAEQCLRMLSEMKIPVTGKDLGGTTGRSVRFDPENHILHVKKLVGGENQL